MCVLTQSNLKITSQKWQNFMFLCKTIFSCHSFMYIYLSHVWFPYTQFYDIFILVKFTKQQNQNVLRSNKCGVNLKLLNYPTNTIFVLFFLTEMLNLILHQFSLFTISKKNTFAVFNMFKITPINSAFFQRNVNFKPKNNVSIGYYRLSKKLKEQHQLVIKSQRIHNHTKRISIYKSVSYQAATSLPPSGGVGSWFIGIWSYPAERKLIVKKM